MKKMWKFSDAIVYRRVINTSFALQMMPKFHFNQYPKISHESLKNFHQKHFASVKKFKIDEKIIFLLFITEISSSDSLKLLFFRL